MAGASQSTNVNRYVRAWLTARALKRELERVEAEVTLAVARLTGAQLSESRRIFADAALTAKYDVRVKVTAKNGSAVDEAEGVRASTAPPWVKKGGT